MGGGRRPSMTVNHSTSSFILAPACPSFCHHYHFPACPVYTLSKSMVGPSWLSSPLPLKIYTSPLTFPKMQFHLSFPLFHHHLHCPSCPLSLFSFSTDVQVFVLVFLSLLDIIFISLLSQCPLLLSSLQLLAGHCLSPFCD